METITEEEFREIQENVKEVHELFGETEELERKVWERRINKYCLCKDKKDGKMYKSS
jgi:hypothetical protein